ncbi:MAG: thermonuclease family protein [Candidatus Pacearchaeota archaeon]
MNKKRKQIILLIFLVVLFIIINYSFLDKFLVSSFGEPFGSEIGIVKRVIDGDTFVIGNESIRFLGINTPERGEYLYAEAKKYLEDLVLNKSVKLEFGKEKYDLYNRKLAYIYLSEEKINLKLVKNGYANFYFPSGKDEHYKEFFDAWEKCINEKLNLCEKSKEECADCVVLKDLDVKEQKVVLENVCDFDCSLKNWSIKDEGRKKFVFSNFSLKSFKEVEIRVDSKANNENILYWKEYDYVWTSSGDSLFLRDDEGKLVLWEGY